MKTYRVELAHTLRQPDVHNGRKDVYSPSDIFHANPSASSVLIVEDAPTLMAAIHEVANYLREYADGNVDYYSARGNNEFGEADTRCYYRVTRRGVRYTYRAVIAEL